MTSHDINIPLDFIDHFKIFDTREGKFLSKDGKMNLTGLELNDKRYIKLPYMNLMDSRNTLVYEYDVVRVINFKELVNGEWVNRGTLDFIIMSNGYGEFIPKTIVEDNPTPLASLRLSRLNSEQFYVIGNIIQPHKVDLSYMGHLVEHMMIQQGEIL